MKITCCKFLITVSILLFGHNLSAQPKHGDYSLFLTQALEKDSNFWVRIHAAETLILNNFAVNTNQTFKRELDQDGEGKIGALSLLARINRKDSLKVDTIGKQILHQFHISHDVHTKLIALETLGKLGLYFQDGQISKLAQTESGGIKTMSQWVLANSGSVNDLNAMVDLLFSEDWYNFVTPPIY